MSPTKEQLDAHFKELTKHEDKFCQEMGYCINRHGAYIYASDEGNCSINLPLTLTTYKQWLIENNILKEV